MQYFDSLNTFEKISEETEVEPKSCEHSTKPCPGCDDLSCEDYCAADKHCGHMQILLPFTKKCCECGFCKNDSEETTGKFTHFSIPSSDFVIHQKRFFHFRISYFSNLIQYSILSSD